MKKSELMATNPLLRPFADPEVGLYPAYDKIKPEHFRPALNFAAAEARRQARKIASNPDAPTFQNTVIALEQATAMFEYVFNILASYTYGARDEEIDKLEEKYFPKYSQLFAEIYTNKDLYRKLNYLDTTQKARLNEEDGYMLEVLKETARYYGAHLSARKMKRIAEIERELTILGTEFDSNLEDQKKSYGLVVENIEDLDGLPQDQIDTAAAEAEERNLEGKWVLTAEDSVTNCVLSYCNNRKLRERYYKETARIGTDPAANNYKVIKKLLALRHERAQLDGYRTYTDWVMTFQMALEKKPVLSFLGELKSKAAPKARKDLAELRKFALTQGINKLEPWDFGYCWEKLRKQKFNFNSETLRPYFPLQSALNGAIKHCEALYGLSFRESKKYPKINKHVITYDVTDTDTNEYLGVMMIDPYLRDNKAGHYYAVELLSHGQYAGKQSAALVLLHLNFAKPTKNTPTLLTEDDVKNTLFHEIGHGIHSLLGKSKYRTLSGQICLMADFSEFPSQLNESWALQRGLLDYYARHHKTGDPIPQEMMEQMSKSAHFMSGYSLTSALKLAYIDLALHSRNPKYINMQKFEPEYLRKNFLGLAFKNASPSLPTFSHIASYGMDSTYYSYLWSGSMAADGFSMFVDGGLYNPALSKKLKHMLRAAGTRMSGDLYSEFRGRNMTPEAFLKNCGIVSKDPFNKAAQHSTYINTLETKPANDNMGTEGNIDAAAKTSRKRAGPTPT